LGEDARGRAAHPTQAGKGLAGRDEHQVRRWTSWGRWTLLAMIAHALLVVIAWNEHSDRPCGCPKRRALLLTWCFEPEGAAA
jgi:hypothetical protein